MDSRYELIREGIGKEEGFVKVNLSPAQGLLILIVFIFVFFIFFNTVNLTQRQAVLTMSGAIVAMVAFWFWLKPWR